MDRRVQYSRLGGVEVLEVVRVPEPQPGRGELRVRVHAAGINPLDAKLFRGLPTAAPHAMRFPSGNGSDFAGVVDAVGEGVPAEQLGAEVLGARLFHAQADHVVVEADAVLAKPAALSWEQAGAITTVGQTAWASSASLQLGPEDTVLVSAAAGGVGILAAQLARRTGARVIGTASRDNHEALRELGVEPVEYGDGLVEAVRALAPGGVTAAMDNHGRASVDAALALGAPPGRIATIADYAAPADYGANLIRGSAATREELAEVIRLVATGELVLPIDSVYPLEQVREAYARLIAGHLRGKIVLRLV